MHTQYKGISTKLIFLQLCSLYNHARKNSFRNLVVAGMKHLEYCEVLNLIGEKDKLFTLKGPSVYKRVEL